MAFPIHDDNSDRRSAPVICIGLIALNALVFVLLQGASGENEFTYAFSTVPQEIVTGRDLVTSPETRIMETSSGRIPVEVPGLGRTPGSVYLTLLTSMFMHGGWAHLLGNMWFLWIFGDNVEDDCGRVRFLIFYLLSGLLASLTHVFLNASGPGAQVPCLGASGAISGVMGAYLVLHPNRRVTVLLFRIVTDVPAYVAVGLWFGFQVVNGLGMLGGSGSGVAYSAHIGGFIAGAALILPFAGTRRNADRDDDFRARLRSSYEMER